MRRLGVVGITLLGLMTLLQGVGSFLSAFWVFGSGGDTKDMALAVVSGFAPVIFLVVAGLLLIAYRERLAARWFADEPIDSSIDAAPLLRVGIILLGFYVALYAASSILVSALDPIVSSAKNRAAFGAGFGEVKTFWDIAPGIAEGMLRLLVGLALVWYSGSLAGWLWTHERAAPVAREGDGMSLCPSCGAPFDPADYVPGSEARCVECGQPLSIGGA